MSTASIYKYITQSHHEPPAATASTLIVHWANARSVIAVNRTNEHLLSSPSQIDASPCTGFLATLLSLATLFCVAVAAFLLLNPAVPDLCTNSPDSATCHAIVADAVLASTDVHVHPAKVLRAILARSLEQHDAASVAVAGMRRRASDARHRAALEDCVQLMELARDRLADAAADRAAVRPEDARTWLSAVLTDHVTCLDGLDIDAPLRDAVAAHLEPLKSLTSASLAVLNTIGSGVGPDEDDRDVLAAVVDKFPLWVPARDRTLLEEADAVQPVQADAVVAKDGSGKYKTVKEAVDAAPDRGKSRYVVYVKKGVYEEHIEVGKMKRELMIVGDGMDATVITGSRNVADGVTTFNSATLGKDARQAQAARCGATGSFYNLQDLKIENTAGPDKQQAVALRVSADRAVVNRCRVEGYQDTLYAHQLRQFYRDCAVFGTVDFVFGNAAAVLQNCVLAARRPARGQQNVVTAQGRDDPNQNTGTSVQRCRVVRAAELAPVAAAPPTFLGRPWKAYSRTVFMESYLDAHVDPRGWLEWVGDFALNTLFYGEYRNEGPGAGTAGRVRWPGYRVITDRSVAMRFTVGQFIQGGNWLNGTGVAYDEGL